MSRRSQREISVLVPPNLLQRTSGDPRRVGPYLVIGRLGSGGTGTAYAAVNPTTKGDPLVAVKVLNSPHLEDPDTRTVLHQRLAVLSNTDGRCYVPPIDFDTATTPPWLAMSYVSGVPLAQYARRHGAMGPGRLIALAAGLAEGISALHAMKVAHGDLKPSNILLSSTGPRILDCALPGDDEHLRRSAAGWLSPERHQGDAPSPAADIFAWGAILAFASTGRLPFGLGEPHVLAERVSTADPDLDGVPAELLPVVRRALAKDPDDRPSVREALGAAIAAWETISDGDTAAVQGTAVTRVLSREWQGIVEPDRLPRVIQLHDSPPRRAMRVPLIAGGAALAVALIGGGGWAALTALSGNGGSGADAEAPASSSPAAPKAAEKTAVVRFDPAEQENPVDGPWIYTRVEKGASAPPSEGTLSPQDWSARWKDADGGASEEAVITTDPEVFCAQFCVPGPGHIEDDRGTYEVTGQDFIDYLSWGQVVIAEVEFAEGGGNGEPREITRITELFPAPPD